MALAPPMFVELWTKLVSLEALNHLAQYVSLAKYMPDRATYVLLLEERMLTTFWDSFTMPYMVQILAGRFALRCLSSKV